MLHAGLERIGYLWGEELALLHTKFAPSSDLPQHRGPGGGDRIGPGPDFPEREPDYRIHPFLSAHGEQNDKTTSITYATRSDPYGRANTGDMKLRRLQQFLQQHSSTSTSAPCCVARTAILRPPCLGTSQRPMPRTSRTRCSKSPRSWRPKRCSTPPGHRAHAGPRPRRRAPRESAGRPALRLAHDRPRPALLRRRGDRHPRACACRTRRSRSANSCWCRSARSCARSATP